ncbi:hypothetical protein CQA81_30295, partial [Klebsiella pneumoniae]
MVMQHCLQRQGAGRPPTALACASSGQLRWREGGGLRIILPVRDKGQTVGQQISPRLACRQVPPWQRDGRQPAKMFAFAI